MVWLVSLHGKPKPVARDGQKNMSYVFMCYVLPIYVT
jgi:hypothetical protein